MTICQPKSTYSLKVISGIANPAWIPTSDVVDTIEATSFTQNLLYKIDQKTQGIYAGPELIEGSLSNSQFSKTPGLVGDQTSFTFSVTTQNTVPINGYVMIEFADDSLQLSRSMTDPLCQSSDQTESFACEAQVYPSGLIRSIIIYEPCGQNAFCSPKQNLAFKISDVRNPRSTKPIVNDFALSTFTQEKFAIDKGSVTASNSNDLAIEPAIFNDITLLEPDSSFDEIITGEFQATYLLRV